MFPTIETRTIHIIDGEALEQWIENKYGFNPDLAASGNVPGDESSGQLQVDVSGNLSDYDQLVLAEVDTGDVGFPLSTIGPILNREAVAGNIPAGQYHIQYMDARIQNGATIYAYW